MPTLCSLRAPKSLFSLAQETTADHQPPAKHCGIALGSTRGLSHPRAMTLGSPLNPQGGTSSSRLPFQATRQHWEASIPFKTLPENFLHLQGQGFSQGWSSSAGWTLHVIPHGMLLPSQTLHGGWAGVPR